MSIKKPGRLTPRYRIKLSNVSGLLKQGSILTEGHRQNNTNAYTKRERRRGRAACRIMGLLRNGENVKNIKNLKPFMRYRIMWQSDSF